MNTVKSHHRISDIDTVRGVVKDSELLVRINPWHDSSFAEIESVIAAGADRIMLPMWKTVKEADSFLKAVAKRAGTILLLETKEAVEVLDEVLENPLVDEIFIGLNDLHLSYELTFMFEPLSNGSVEALCKKCRAKGVPYGFGGIARIGQGTLPAEKIVMEHYRLGSTMTILSRSFCNTDEITDINEISAVFEENMARLREYESSLSQKSSAEFEQNTREVAICISQIVEKIKEKRAGK